MEWRLGSFGTENFGEKKYPRPAAVIMQYTGLAEVYGNEPPTYNCVGTNDAIASWRTMNSRIKKFVAMERLRKLKFLTAWGTALVLAKEQLRKVGLTAR